MKQTKIESAKFHHQILEAWKRIDSPSLSPSVHASDGAEQLAHDWSNVPFSFLNTLFLTEELTGTKVLNLSEPDALIGREKR